MIVIIKQMIITVMMIVITKLIKKIRHNHSSPPISLNPPPLPCCLCSLKWWPEVVNRKWRFYVTGNYAREANTALMKLWWRVESKHSLWWWWWWWWRRVIRRLTESCQPTILHNKLRYRSRRLFFFLECTVYRWLRKTPQTYITTQIL